MDIWKYRVLCLIQIGKNCVGYESVKGESFVGFLTCCWRGVSSIAFVGRSYGCSALVDRCNCDG